MVGSKEKVTTPRPERACFRDVPTTAGKGRRHTSFRPIYRLVCLRAAEREERAVAREECSCYFRNQIRHDWFGEFFFGWGVDE